MKEYQFREIIFWLSLIACLLAYDAKIEWLATILTWISIFCFVFVIIGAWVNAEHKK